MAPATRSISVKLGFGGGYTRPEDAEVLRINVAGDGSDSIYSVKTKIAEAAGGQMSAEDLLLSFGPCDRKLGRQYVKDPSVDEQSLKLSQYSILDWLERFPHWMLTVGLLPPTPPPPGVAIHKAAAAAEQKDADRAVQDARAKGEIPKISDLPAPWGDKPYAAPPREELVSTGYVPPIYPPGSNPLKNVSA